MINIIIIIYVYSFINMNNSLYMIMYVSTMCIYRDYCVDHLNPLNSYLYIYYIG